MEVCRPPSRGGVGGASYTPLGTPRPGSRGASHAVRLTPRKSSVEAWGVDTVPAPTGPITSVDLASPAKRTPQRPGSRPGSRTGQGTPTPRPPSRNTLENAVPASVIDCGPGSATADAKSKKIGDGGQVDHRLAEAALERRGNAAARNDLADQTRIFDAVESTKWDKKYKYFSQESMKGTYKTFARAKHDPFNKDPSWGKSILAGVSENCDKKGLQPSDLFQNIDITGDGLLNRAEMKRVLVSVQPALSDLELAAIFDVIDNDNSGEVSINEFCEALDKGRQVGHSADKTAARHRNPVHKIKRFPPAKVDGFDHIEPPLLYPHGDEQLCEDVQRSMMQRLWPLVVQSPRQDLEKRVHRYQYFGGGADVSRFRRTYRAMQRWQEAHPEAVAAKESGAPHTQNLAFVWDKKARCKKHPDPLR